MESKNLQQSLSDNDDSSEDETQIQWVEESESSVSDDDDDAEFDDNKICRIISPPKDNLKSICGYFKENEKDDYIPRKKSKINQQLSIRNNVDPKQIFRNWSKSESYQSGHGVELLTTPFKLCTINNFIDNTVILSHIRDEINFVKWNKRCLDLYEFLQTDDLNADEHKYLKNIYEFLKSVVMPWVKEATGLPLERISASCSAYTNSDYLLVHDDLQGDRCVAFILYLTGIDENNDEIWKPEYGGALQLFNKDENGQPLKPIKDIYPKHNQFTFFQVRNDSYHQVAEVLTMNYARLSINGWFHTDKIPLEDPPKLIVPNYGLFGSYLHHPSVEMALEDYINPIFLMDDTAKNINSYIEENSEISLEQFFKRDTYRNIENDLKSEDICWKWVGPVNRRHYEIADETSLPENLRNFINMFKSLTIFKLLKTYTDLDLVPDGNVNPLVRWELQRWTPGCYSLMSEKTWFTDNELDVIVYFGCLNVHVNSGHIMYIARNENDQEALVTILPKNNTLNIIYREEETARIMPYIPHRTRNPLFYTIVCSYK